MIDNLVRDLQVLRKADSLIGRFGSMSSRVALAFLLLRG